MDGTSDYLLLYFEKEGLGNCNTTSSSGHQYMMPQSDQIIPYTYNYALEKMDVIECLAKSYGYFPLKKEQREVVDILKGERCVCVSSHSVWEKCLLRNSSKGF